MLAQKRNKPIIPRITKHFAMELCTVFGWSLRTTRLSRPLPSQQTKAWANLPPKDFQKRMNETLIAQDYRQLVEQFGSPLLLLDKAAVRKQ